MKRRRFGAERVDGQHRPRILHRFDKTKKSTGDRALDRRWHFRPHRVGPTEVELDREELEDGDVLGGGDAHGQRFYRRPLAQRYAATAFQTAGSSSLAQNASAARR